MDYLQIHKDSLAKLSREDLESVVLGMAVMVAMYPPAITMAKLYHTFAPEAFQPGTEEGVKVALDYIDSTGKKIQQAMNERN